MPRRLALGRGVVGRNNAAIIGRDNAANLTLIRRRFTPEVRVRRLQGSPKWKCRKVQKMSL